MNNKSIVKTLNKIIDKNIKKNENNTTQNKLLYKAGSSLVAIIIPKISY